MVDRIEFGEEKIVVVARPRVVAAHCPRCGAQSERFHSRYQRTLADLPSHGRAVQIRITVRRLRCGRGDCPQRIFAERLDEGIATRFARRTARMEHIVHHLGLALGGRPGSCLAERLAVQVSKDTLLRVIRRRSPRLRLPLGAIGIDDFAWRRGCRYGTVICDLERRRIVALLAGRAKLDLLNARLLGAA